MLIPWLAQTSTLTMPNCGWTCGSTDLPKSSTYRNSGEILLNLPYTAVQPVFNSGWTCGSTTPLQKFNRISFWWTTVQPPLNSGSTAPVDYVTNGSFWGASIYIPSHTPPHHTRHNTIKTHSLLEKRALNSYFSSPSLELKSIANPWAKPWCEIEGCEISHFISTFPLILKIWALVFHQESSWPLWSKKGGLGLEKTRLFVGSSMGK